MSKLFIEDTTLTGIADAIRSKNGASESMTPSEMITAIGNIETGGGSGSTGTLSIVKVTATNTGTTKGAPKNFNVSAYVSNGDDFAIIYETYAGENKYVQIFPKSENVYGTTASGFAPVQYGIKPGNFTKYITSSYGATYDNGVISITTSSDKYPSDYIYLIYMQK